MVQNNMLSIKTRIKSKWIESNWIQKYDSRPLKMWNLNVVFQKVRWRVETEIVSEKAGN